MSNLPNPGVKLPAIYTVRAKGTFLQPEQVPPAWAPIPEGIVTGGYRCKKINQFDPILSTDPAPIENIYMLTGTFKVGAEDSAVDSVHLRPQLTGDFDLVDYCTSIGHECISYTEDEADVWLQALDEKKRGNDSERGRFLKKLAKRKMYEYAQKNEAAFAELFEQFKAAFMETMVTNFFPPTYLMMSGWGLHCLWHLTEEDIRAQVNEPAASLRVKEVNAWLVKVINTAHAKSVCDSVINEGVSILPEMDASMSAPGTGSLCFPGVKNMKCPAYPRQTFIYDIGEGSSGVALSMAAIQAKLASSSIPEEKAKDSGNNNAPAPAKKPKSTPIGSGQPDANGFIHTWEDFATKMVVVHPGEEAVNLAELVDSLGAYGKVKVIDPVAGTSTGSGWIQKDVGRSARLINDAAKTIWHDSRTGGYAAILQRVRGNITKSPINLSLILSNDKRLGFHTLSYDTFDNKLNVDGKVPADIDNFISGLNVKLSDTFSAAFIGLHEGVYHEAKKRSHDRLYDFIKGLPAWDGVSRIDTLFEKAFDNANHNSFVKIASRKSMIGWAVRALSYDKPVEMHTAPVLVGKQNAGKSAFVKTLFYNDEHGFSGEGKLVTDTSNRESILAVQGKWIFEIAELAGMHKSDNESVKDWLSCSRHTLRVPYAREAVTWNARCCFIGTTNNTEFLRDDTGNRRLLPVNTDCNGKLISQFNMQWVIDNRDQLWAEARDIAQAWIDAGRNKQTAPWNLTLEDIALLNSLSRFYTMEDIEHEHGAAWLAKLSDAWVAGGCKEEERPKVTMLEFLVQGLHIDERNALDKKNSWKAKILLKEGWVSTKKQPIVRDAKGRNTGSRTMEYEYRP